MPRVDDGSKIARRHDDADTKKPNPQLTTSTSTNLVDAVGVADDRMFVFAYVAEGEIAWADEQFD